MDSVSESKNQPNRTVTWTDQDVQWMSRAIELAKRGLGHVEPNPMVGCVLVKGGNLIGEGCHEQFGQAHAEINALDSVSEEPLGATAYVTLEPCSHFGKTPPCARSLIEAKVGRVVIAQQDPFAEVSGRGIEMLRDAGIQVATGLLEREARQLNAAYLKRTEEGLPWIVAKYAMTLDGKIATESGNSQWISSEESRAVVHRIRGRMDGILVGANTALADDPMLNARPPGARVARRLVMDSQLRLSLTSKLVRSAGDFPVEVCCGSGADSSKVNALRERGVEVTIIETDCKQTRLLQFLRMQVSERGATNILVEGGGQLLGSLRDAGQLDELHLFLGPVLIGGQGAVSPIAGVGATKIAEGMSLRILSSQIVGGDVYVRAVKNTERNER